ncbi:peptidoglycan O-acetyltransferase [mine drainage metagenome]|uniref:Peptidoglycan O-acetyltransferase n=1 Tax=mine drainage metagenome TaxID=410659 RepID=A0A1J5S6M4_9ZZZZ
MLFNSYGFIFLFLPVVLLCFFQLARFNHGYAAGWLTLSSLFFYGYWNPAYVGLLLGSIVCNYIWGLWIAKANAEKNHRLYSQKDYLLAFAITANLGLLGYFKYTSFLLGSINDIAGTALSLGDIILPLGISFFTFTQIAFLVDVRQGKVKESNFLHYVLFVTYFPHLIAGPILHHKEMMPQFARSGTYCFHYENMAVGLAIFFIGLFKKVVLADGVSECVGPIFGAPAAGIQLNFIEAWFGALSYALQLYFDFSGYSDMAIGLSRMLGVALPLNFHSPYKSVNIIEFWRRWHMTLSRFLRDYLYFPMGGNRKGKARRHLNLLVTMLLGGLWHGAAWTYVIWGGLHGLYLVINHSWQAVRQKLGQNPDLPLSQPMHFASVILTFLAVTLAWVFFRADTLDHAIALIRTMLGGNGWSLQSSHGLIHVASRNLLSIGFLLIWLAPNTQQIMQRFKPALNIPDGTNSTRLSWYPSYKWALIHAFVALIGLLSISELNQFIYFQF